RCRSRTIANPRSLPRRWMRPATSWRTFWSSASSFFWSSFCRSSTRRRTSRTLRSRVSCFSRRASAERSCPFFSSSSRIFSSSVFCPSSWRCIAALSFSSCSRAAAPATDRARIRWTSTMATFPFEPAAGAGVWAQAAPPTPVTRARPVAVHHTAVRRIIPPPQLEGRARREVEVPEALALLLVEFDPIVHLDGAERRVPSEAQPGPVPEVRGVDLAARRDVGAPYVPYIVEDGGLDPEEKRDLVLDRAQELGVAPDPGARAVLGRDLERLELPERVRTAQVEALEQGHRILVPADRVARHEPEAQHVIQPGRRLVVGRGEDAPDEALPEAHPRKVQADRRGPAPGRVEDAVTRVAAEAQPDQGRQVGALLREELRAAQGVDVADAVLADPVQRVPPGVLPERVAEPDVAAEGVDGVVGQDPPGIEDVEAGREGPVEEPGLGEPDGAGLQALAAAQAEEHLPALAEEV